RAGLFPPQTGACVAPARGLAPAVAAPLEDAVMHPLARSPEYRPESAAAFAAELGPTQAEASGIDWSRAPTKPLRGAPPSRWPAAAVAGRNGWVLAALAVAAATVIAFALTLSLGSGSNKPSRPAAPPSMRRT